MIHEDDEPPEDDDKSKWEKYYQLETAGIHEYGNSEKEEKDRLIRKSGDILNRTVERRSDGYYVRLPWKDAHMLLLDNYSTAIRCLENIWCSMQKDQNLLQRYDAVFQEQILLNILEDVPKSKPPPERRIHYLPHQAVMTPRNQQQSSV
uniref:Protein polybromo-1 n=1 Tax=Haemonchus contortus TaxID=6289 RepID=A0A7I4Z2V6_HAECO